MNSYMLYATVIPKLLEVISFVGICCFILLFTLSFMNVRNKKIFYMLYNRLSTISINSFTGAKYPRCYDWTEENKINEPCQLSIELGF